MSEDEAAVLRRADIERRAQIVASGLSYRFREHQWSYGKWAKKASLLIWAQIAAAVATASAVTSAVTNNANLSWVAATFAALALAVTQYERLAHPAVTAAAHKRAADRFSTLLSDYRDFIDLEIPDLSPQTARRRFGELQEQRRKLIDESIATEERAREAVATESAERRAAKDAARKASKAEAQTASKPTETDRRSLRQRAFSR